jgi:hypothetical protein
VDFDRRQLTVPRSKNGKSIPAQLAGVDATFLAAGYTRHQLPLIEQGEKPLAHRWRILVHQKESREADREIRTYALHLPRR